MSQKKDEEGDKERNVGEKQEEEAELDLSSIIISVAIILLITTIISLVIVLLQRIDESESAKNYCLKPACVIAASKLLNTIDPHVDPCEDFYNYACGTYIKVANEVNTTTEIFKLKKTAKKQLYEIYNENPKDSDNLPHQNLKKLYGFCMDSEGRKKGVEYMNKILKRLGGWPVLQKNWEPLDFYWINMVIKLRQHGLYHSIFLEVTYYDDKKTKRNYLEIAPGFNFRETDVSKQNYTNYLTEIAIAFGADPLIAKHEMNEACEFSYKIEKIYQKYFEDYEKLDNETLITMKELQEKKPQVNWMGFIRQILHPYEIKETDLVVNKIDGFMEEFDNLLNNTPRKVQANYMIWVAIKSELNWLPEELSKIINKYKRKHDAEQQRIDVCLSQIRKDFPYVAEALYSKKYVSKEAREKVTEIVQEAREEYRNVLKENTWMDENIKSFAFKKLDAMKMVIGGYEEGGEALLQQLYYAYENVNTSENYLDFILKIRKEVVNFAYSFINKPSHFANILSHLQWTITVNAYYSPENIMLVPAAFLQDMVYNSDYPDYLHYAVLAAVAGHEITHGFTKLSNKYGIEGERNEWWTTQTTSNYEKSTQCLVDIYENYTESYLGFQLNGTLALEENMADMIGTRVAYKLFVKNFQEEYNAMLPGFEDFTPNQLFWIANARFYCDPQEISRNKTKELDGAHGLSSFRVVVPNAHLGYFAKDFNCELGTRMNPVEKCDVL